MRSPFAFVFFLWIEIVAGLSCYQSTPSASGVTNEKKECPVEAMDVCYSQSTGMVKVLGCGINSPVFCGQNDCCSTDNCNDPGTGGGNLQDFQVENQKCMDMISDLGPCAEPTAPDPTNKEAFTEYLDSYCKSDCFGHVRRLMAKMAECLDGLYKKNDMELPTNYMQIFDLTCQKNDLSGDYCLAHQLDMLAISKRPTTNVGLNTSSLFNEICGAYAEWGCCFSSLMDAFGSAATTVTETYTDLCGWSSLPSPCLKAGETKTVLDLKINSNIKWDTWKTLTKEQKIGIELAAAKDVARKAGVPLEKVSVGMFVQESNSVTMEFEVEPAKTNSDIAELKTNLENSLNEDNQAWTDLEKSLPEGAVDGSLETTSAVEEKKITNNANIDGMVDSSSSRITANLMARLCSAVFMIAFIRL